MAVERDDGRETISPDNQPAALDQVAEVTSERPSKIDRYEIRHELGRGAMGSVFAAWDPKLCREVAVKFVATKQRNQSKGRARFLREARAIAAIGQANVVQIFDYSGLDSEALYLVMEKLEGRDLWELMHTHRQFPEAIAALIGHELCLALEAAHQVGIIHRDLKPENVFVTHAGRVVLTDFGIVKAIADDAAVEGFTERTEVIGTPGFMAPELMRGKNLSPMTDVFALGALLYNITTMQMPYEGQSPVALLQAAQKGLYVDPRRYQPSLSNAFCVLIKSCLQASPAARPQSAEMLRLQLRAILDDVAEHAFGDDLLAWLHDPAAFAEQSHRRAAGHLLDQMTVAVAHGQREEALGLRARVLALDPFNEAWRPLLAPLLPELAESRQTTRNGAELARAKGPRARSRGGQRGSVAARVAAGVLLVASLLGVFAVDHVLIADGDVGQPMQQATDSAADAALAAQSNHSGPAMDQGHERGPAPEPDHEGAGSAPAVVAPTGELALTIEGRGAWLILDGHGVGHVNQQTLQLPAGRHRVVLVRRAQQTLRRWVNIGPGAQEQWHVPEGLEQGDQA